MKHPLAIGVLTVFAIVGTSVGGAYLGTKQDWELAALQRGKKLKTNFVAFTTLSKPTHPKFIVLFDESQDPGKRADHEKQWTYNSSKGSLEAVCKQIHKETAWTMFSGIKEDLREDFLNFCCEDAIPYIPPEPRTD